MKEFVVKHRVKLIVVCILILLYVLAPMAIRATMPFKICQYDPQSVTANESDKDGIVMYTDMQFITTLILY